MERLCGPRNQAPSRAAWAAQHVPDWVAECTNYPADMAEVALAHKISNAVEAAYRRGDMIEKRRAMMAAWAEFLSGKALGGNVVRIG